MTLYGQLSKLGPFLGPQTSTAPTHIQRAPEDPTKISGLPRPPKVGKIMAQNLEKAIILHTFGVQVFLT